MVCRKQNNLLVGNIRIVFLDSIAQIECNRDIFLILNMCDYGVGMSADGGLVGRRDLKPDDIEPQHCDQEKSAANDIQTAP